MATRYTGIEFADAKAHDDKLGEVELYLLDRIKEAGNASIARSWAEAYALLKGTLNSRTEVKS